MKLVFKDFTVELKTYQGNKVVANIECPRNKTKITGLMNQAEAKTLSAAIKETAQGGKK